MWYQNQVRMQYYTAACFWLVGHRKRRCSTNSQPYTTVFYRGQMQPHSQAFPLHMHTHKNKQARGGLFSVQGERPRKEAGLDAQSSCGTGCRVVVQNYSVHIW